MKVELIDATIVTLKSTYSFNIIIVESHTNSSSSSNVNDPPKINQNINVNGRAYLEANIVSISESGYLTVEFSKDIRIPANFSRINDT